MDPRALDGLNPQTIPRLDALIDELTGGRLTDDALKAIRAAPPGRVVAIQSY